MRGTLLWQIGETLTLSKIVSLEWAALKPDGGSIMVSIPIDKG